MSNITQKWVDVLKPFSVNYKSGLTASEISRKTGIPQQTATRILNSLIEDNILKYKKEGKNKSFYFDLESLNTLNLLQIIESQKAVDFNIKNPKISAILNNLMKYCKTIIIFGSYASDKFNKESDLDLVVFSANKKQFNKEINKFPLEINCQFISYPEFKSLLKKKNALALEVLSNHILIGDIAKIIGVFLNG